MTIGMLVLILLEMFLEVSSANVSGLHRTASYQPVEHHALLGQSFVNISGISVVRCSARCLRHQRCLSFNYDHINRVCQMNNATREQVRESFQGNQPFSFYDATAEAITFKNSDFSSSTFGAPYITECLYPDKLGLEDGSIPDETLSASSNWAKINGYNVESTPGGGRLNKIPPDSEAIGAWQPTVADTNQWIQVDLGNPTYVTGVLMQGRQDHTRQWVTKYKVQYQPPSQTSLCDVKDQLDQTQVFDGNTNNSGIVESQFYKPVLAVKVRIVPVEWNEFIALRFELLGCKYP